MMQVINTMVQVVGGLAALLLILLAMPASKMRDVLLPFVAWTLTAIFGVYICSPVDLVPEMFLGPLGIFDDAAALAACVATVAAALTFRRSSEQPAEQAKQLQPPPVQ